MQLKKEEINVSEIAIWLAKVSVKYDKPILFVISEFTKAFDMYLDTNHAKLHLINEMSK